MGKLCAILFFVPLALSAGAAASIEGSSHLAVIPASRAVALDGHTVTLPHDLAPVTILILGFGRNSAAPAMAWGMHLHSLAVTPSVGFYDLAMLGEAPSLVRPFIIRSMRKQVPDSIKANFVPLNEGAEAWKQISAFTPTDPDAAYVLLVDRTGAVHWQTHDPLSPATLNELTTATRKLLAEAR